MAKHRFLAAAQIPPMSSVRRHVVKYDETCAERRGNISPINTTRGEIRVPTGKSPSPIMLAISLTPACIRSQFHLVFGHSRDARDGGYKRSVPFVLKHGSMAPHLLLRWFYPHVLARRRCLSVLSDVAHRAAIYEGRCIKCSINIIAGNKR